MLDVANRISLLFTGLLLAIQGRFRALRVGSSITGPIAAIIILAIIVVGGVIIYFIVIAPGPPTTTYP